MTGINLSDPSIKGDIASRLSTLAQRVERLDGGVVVFSRGQAATRAGVFAGRLSGIEGHNVGVVYATIILDNLIDRWELEDGAFWASALGQALAWWTGIPHVSPTQRRGIAAVTLNASRQYIHKLFGPGDLAADTLARELQRRWPNAIKAA